MSRGGVSPTRTSSTHSGWDRKRFRAPLVAAPARLTSRQATGNDGPARGVRGYKAVSGDYHRSPGPASGPREAVGIDITGHVRLVGRAPPRPDRPIARRSGSPDRPVARKPSLPAIPGSLSTATDRQRSTRFHDLFGSWRPAPHRQQSTCGQPCPPALPSCSSRSGFPAPVGELLWHGRNASTPPPARTSAAVHHGRANARG